MGAGPPVTPANSSTGSSLWLSQSSKDLYSISAQHAWSRPSTVQLPPDAEMRAYAACQDALWALDSLGQVFIRTLSRSCPTGMHWTRLDLSQLGMASVTQLPGPCWACMNPCMTVAGSQDTDSLATLAAARAS